MSSVLQKLCSGQSSHACTNDSYVARSLCGGETLIHHSYKLTVVCVLKALNQRVPNAPSDGENNGSHYNQRNCQDNSNQSELSCRKIMKIYQIQ